MVVLNISRDNIESTHSGEITQLKSQYSEEDKEIIEAFLMAKKSFKLEASVQVLNGQLTQEESYRRGLSDN